MRSRARARRGALRRASSDRSYDPRVSESRFFPTRRLGDARPLRGGYAARVAADTEVEAEIVESHEIARETPRALARPATAGVVVYAAAAGAASVVPVPFVDALLARLARGSAMRRVAQ